MALAPAAARSPGEQFRLEITYFKTGIFKSFPLPAAETKQNMVEEPKTTKKYSKKKKKKKRKYKKGKGISTLAEIKGDLQKQNKLGWRTFFFWTCQIVFPPHILWRHRELVR